MSSDRARPQPPAECANCGEEIPRSAKACPGCGADERTGWRENSATLYDGLDLPDEAFADDSSPTAASPTKPTARINGVAWYWWFVAVALIVALILGATAALG